VKPNFLTVLKDLKYRFDEYLITGFNCLTKNLNGTERHRVLVKGDGFNMKASVGGVNMYFDKAQYRRWIKPAIMKCLETQGNWDHKAVLPRQKTYKADSSSRVSCSISVLSLHGTYAHRAAGCCRHFELTAFEK
jgi:hypothetical protein